MRKRLFLLLLAFISLCQMYAVERTKLNFNGGWLLKVGDFQGAEQANYKDAGWKQITLPRAFNEKEAFKVSIEQLSDTIMWYRKHFHIQEVGDRKYFIEFEGVRFGADIWLNGKKVGYTENGVMASGFDLTPYIIKGENVIAVRVDNSWSYRERATGQRYQWNDKNFNANYGGIPKNVFLHITDKLYQTLPLYNNLKTTGIYIYGSNYDIAGKKVTVNAESQVRNEDSKPRSFRFFAKILDADGKEVGHFDGERYTLKPGETKTVKVSGLLNNAHFWSWGYGYLYTVKTLLKADDGSKIDDVITKTGFRKTQFGEGKFYLNDRAIMMHGYAQRTSNEWPGVGMSVPAWLSDYSNKLMVESGGNLVRWMHVCPWKQDIESCDRVGLIQAMPAGDAERDVEGRRWEQRLELMKEAIIYNRNNPSIIFYESGNKGVSREHMLQMKAIRDEFDPHGGRASGSREMLNINVAEYGGEMLYINKSKKHPMWSMEYHRDEGLRKYWDEQSYPYHKEGDGPLYRGKPAFEYNHNMDTFAALPGEEPLVAAFAHAQTLAVDKEFYLVAGTYHIFCLLDGSWLVVPVACDIGGVFFRRYPAIPHYLMSKEGILWDAHCIGYTARTVVCLTTMMGIGIREDDLGTAIAYSFSGARTLLPVFKPSLYHACSKGIHVVVVFEGRFAAIQRSVAFLMVRIALLIPVFTQTLVAMILHRPHRVLLALVDVKHFAAVFSLVDVEHLSAAAGSASVRVELIADGFHL